jgi:hypothetical protein
MWPVTKKAAENQMEKGKMTLVPCILALNSSPFSLRRRHRRRLQRVCDIRWRLMYMEAGWQASI